MHIASSARSRRSREVSSAARRWGRRGGVGAGGALAGFARRRWRRSPRPSVPSPSPARSRGARPPAGPGRRGSPISPIPASTGATSSSALSRSAGEPTSVRSRTSPTWKAVSSTAASTRARKRSARPRLGDHLGRVDPGRHRRHPQPHPAPGGDPLGPQHRLLPGRVGVERQHHLLDHPRERRHLLAGDRRPHHRHRLLDPGLVQRRARRCSPRPRPPAPALAIAAFGEVDAVEHLALVEEVGLGRVHVLGALVGAHRAAAEAEGAAAAVADREHDPGAEAVVLAAAAGCAGRARRRAARRR